MSKKEKEKKKGFFAWKGLKSIEFRVLGWLWRGMMIIVFVFYVGANALASWTWVKVKWVRTQELSRLEPLLKEAGASGDFSWAGTWMQDRPLSETNELIAHSAPYSAMLPVFVFFDFSDRMSRLGDTKQADLWNMIAHYRMRFDLLRCGMADGVEQGRDLLDILSSLNKNYYYRDMTLETRKHLVRKVLDFDEKYPAMDDPEDLCRRLARINGVEFNLLPRREWESFRLGLRASTELNLKMDGKNPFAKPVPDPKKGKKK